MSSSSIKKGDLVVVTGFTLTNDGVGQVHRILATVVDVGKSDIFAKDESKSFRGIFKTPIERCAKIDLKCEKLQTKVLKPEVGNLVLSLIEKFGSTEKKTGVLMEITDTPWASKTAKILSGDELEIVPYESLIVLE